jgi:hypothetical protein
MGMIATDALSSRVVFTTRRVIGRRPFLADLLRLGSGIWLAYVSGCNGGGSQVAPPPPPPPAANITAVWANDGGDKVTQDELRATRGVGKVLNRLWDGNKISFFGARNEVVNFNVILEAGRAAAHNVTVSFDTLTGPNGAAIASLPAAGPDGVFDWTHRPIELFYSRYLQIKGLSRFSYPTTIDEREIPLRLQRPNVNGVANPGTTWQDRPDHDKFYPDIAVPLEVEPNFDIAAGQNQSVWVDVYIPKAIPPGLYTGNVVVKENGTLVKSIPVQLKVYDFDLPDAASAKTMVYISSPDINRRYFGTTFIDPASPDGPSAQLIRDRHFLLAHRHRISLIDHGNQSDCNSTAVLPCAEWIPRLNGTLFTSANGYDGPGVGVGNNLYVAGTYGSWGQSADQTTMNNMTNSLATWFSQNVTTPTDVLFYLADEPKPAQYPQVETWAQYILNNPGPGHQVRSFATVSLPIAAGTPTQPAQMPSLDIIGSTLGVGITSDWEAAAALYTNPMNPRHQFYMYNGARPASGSFATEDDGVALRELAWGHYKKHINRWFYWNSTYYNNVQGNTGEVDLFQTAQTFGTNSGFDPVLGQTGAGYGNGEGVKFYPGTDRVRPASSLGLSGPIASLDLKHWRRGLQDVEYLLLAAAKDPVTVQSIVNSIVPKVLWEYGVTNPNDPTYVLTDISWPIDPDVWEAAREKLAQIIAPSTTAAFKPALAGAA